MTPRIVDWSLACATGIAFATGLLTLVSGRAESRWVFDVHAVAGYALLLLMLPKLVRVRRRLLPGGRDWRVWAGRGAAVFGTAVVLSGALWALGAPGVWLGYNLLNWHIIGGFVLTAIMSLHMVLRARPLRRSDLAERRSLLRLGAVSLAAIAALPLKERLSATAGWPGANRRFTGSREVASFTGNAFPTVSWVADRPQPIERERWELRIGGMVARPAALRYVDLDRNEQLTAPSTGKARRCAICLQRCNPCPRRAGCVLCRRQATAGACRSPLRRNVSSPPASAANRSATAMARRRASSPPASAASSG